MITIVDYGMGNLRSVVNAFEALNTEVTVTDDPAALERATGVVLPGVGAFGDGMRNLIARGFREPLEACVVRRGVPYLGICLGMQFLVEESLEDGRHQGLGWIRGRVERIEPGNPACKVPHMGWNELEFPRPSALFEGLPERPVFYFVHSYHVVVPPPDADVVTASCSHGVPVAAALQRGNLFGVQFHPEKSQQVGLRVLDNFVRVCTAAHAIASS